MPTKTIRAECDAFIKQAGPDLPEGNARAIEISFFTGAVAVLTTLSLGGNLSALKREVMEWSQSLGGR